MFSLKTLVSFPSGTSVISQFSEITPQKRWATKKAGGGSKNGRDSNPKYRGVKKFGGESVIPGNIIVRQKGSKFHAGEGVKVGKDFTLFAMVPGYVRFTRNDNTKTSYVHVVSKERYDKLEEQKLFKKCVNDETERGKVWPDVYNKLLQATVHQRA